MSYSSQFIRRIGVYDNDNKAARAPGRYAVRAGGSVAQPDKDLIQVMTERFGHRHGYVGNTYGLGD